MYGVSGIWILLIIIGVLLLVLLSLYTSGRTRARRSAGGTRGYTLDRRGPRMTRVPGTSNVAQKGEDRNDARNEADVSSGDKPKKINPTN